MTPLPPLSPRVPLSGVVRTISYHRGLDYNILEAFARLRHEKGLAFAQQRLRSMYPGLMTSTYERYHAALDDIDVLLVRLNNHFRVEEPRITWEASHGL